MFLESYFCPFHTFSFEMGSAKKRKRTHHGETENGFAQLAAKIKAGKVLLSPFLKNLHEVLVKLSHGQVFQQDEHGYDIHTSVCNQWLSTRLKYSDITYLSNLLYEELFRHFELLFYGIPPPVVVLDEYGCLSPPTEGTREEFILLLLCSLVILKFLKFNMFHVFKKCQLLITMLQMLCEINSTLQLPFQSKDNTDVLTILEVCLDEFTMNHDMAMDFVMAHHVSTTDEIFVVPNHRFGKVHAIMELVSKHVIVSYHDEVTFRKFIDSLSWSSLDVQRPAMTFDSAMSLLNYPVISTASHFLQAHLIIMASRCIGIHNSRALDGLIMTQYIMALEYSVLLYLGFIPKLNIFDCIFRDGSTTSFDDARPSFNSCIQSSTSDKLRKHIDKLSDWCYTSTRGLMSKTTPEIQEDVIAYIKDCRTLIYEKIGDEVFQVLTCMVRSLLAEESKWSSKDCKPNLGELYCISAVLKLQGSILLQLLPFLRKSRELGCTRTSEQTAEYDFILSIISSIGHYGENKNAQKILFGAAERNNGRHSDIKLAFAHFTNLLSYSFTCKVAPLWKSCIFLMIHILDLLVIEEGNLDVFHGFMRTGHMSPCIFQANIGKEPAYRPSTIIICSNFQKVRNQIHYLKNGDNNSNTCSGEKFLKCLPDFEENHSDFEDLADFIECTPGKNYSAYIKKRTMFRKWKFSKISAIKHSAKRRIQQNVRDSRAV